MATVEDWLAAGFRALMQTGPAGLLPAGLARDLAVAEAGFYRHFNDMDAFRAEMLADWAARAYGDVMAGAGAGNGPAAQLRGLVIAMAGAAAEDAAVRAWARADAVVAQAVAEMDARRFNAVKALCLAAGASDAELPMLICAACAGYGALAPPAQAEAGVLSLLRMAGIS